MTFLSQGGRGREPNFVDRLVLGATAPLQRWMVVGGEGVVEGVKSYVDLRGVREANLALEDEARRLRGELNGLIELRGENARLKSALGYVEATPGVQVLARVVGFGPAASPPTVRLDRGADVGIREGMPVLTVDGVVGVVVRVTAGSADVSLISDPRTRVGVRVQRSRARATVAGAGAARPMRLENALRADDLEDGDVLVTSGADGIFPGGLAVGHVRRLSRTNLGVFQEAEVHPAVELGRIEEVLVVTSPVERTLEAVLPALDSDPLSPAGATNGGR